MAKLVTLSLARLSLKNIPRNKLILATNFVIFISLFAIFASIISLVYERKIETLNKYLTNELGNEIIYNHWLSETPKNISNIESLLSQVSRENNYLLYLKSLNNKLVTDRDIVLNPTIDLLSFTVFHLDALEDSLRDAVMVSSNVKDIEEIKKKKLSLGNIFSDFSNKLPTEVGQMRYSSFWSLLSAKQKKESYKKALAARPLMINNLEKLADLNISFNLNFYSKKKSESKIKILEIKNNIKKLSKKESRSIFIAFIIQLIIFGIIQFFEFGFELTQKRKKKKL